MGQCASSTVSLVDGDPVYCSRQSHACNPSSCSIRPTYSTRFHRLMLEFCLQNGMIVAAMSMTHCAVTHVCSSISTVLPPTRTFFGARRKLADDGGNPRQNPEPNKPRVGVGRFRCPVLQTKQTDPGTSETGLWPPHEAARSTTRSSSSLGEGQESARFVLVHTVECRHRQHPRRRRPRSSHTPRYRHGDFISSAAACQEHLPAPESRAA